MTNEAVNVKVGCNTGDSMTRSDRKLRKLQIPYTNDELTRIEQQLSKHRDIALQTAVWLGAEGGLRLGEICNLPVIHIDLDKRTVFVDGKTRERYTFFSEKTDRCLQQWLSDRAPDCGHEFLLHDAQGEPLSPRALSMRFRRVARKAGVDGSSFHRLRHTMISNLLMGGLEVSTIMAAGGWTSSATPWCRQRAPVAPDRMSRDYREAMDRVSFFASVASDDACSPFVSKLANRTTSS